ncbi:hypothetical protein ABID86_007351, partial [Methylobacterium radiotolerans]
MSAKLDSLTRPATMEVSSHHGAENERRLCPDRIA